MIIIFSIIRSDCDLIFRRVHPLLMCCQSKKKKQIYVNVPQLCLISVHGEV